MIIMANAKNLLFLPFVLLIGLCLSSASYVGDRECSKGMTFWCEHIMNAKKCNAVDFCIKTVWETHQVKIDNTPLCDDCKQWVAQARDLITNKDTTDQVIQSLELSCQLCPNENGRKKCKQIIEDNINEIIKLIRSQMDPDGICSAIHLCNNEMFTDMFAKGRVEEESKEKLLPFTCGQCSMIGSYMESKFKALNHDEVLDGTLKICGELSSFSDSCMNVILKNSDDVYDQLRKQITRQNLCQATCAGHNQYSEGIVGIEPNFASSEIPCKLCEQLMLHLRELLITNTTEIEFKNILEGFCSQMPQIEDECISITNQYYEHIYQFLVDGLDANKTCVMVGVCDAAGKKLYKAPSMPLLSNDLFPEPSLSSKGHKSVEIIYDENSLRLYKDGKWCTACEYTMNLIHVEMGKNTVQDKIVEYARKSCKTLPKYAQECESIIDMFGDEIANAIYHSTDPRYVCPSVKLCPPNFDLTYLEKNAVSDSPTCPFCLLAIQEIEDIVKSNRTKENVERVLDQLCTHLSDKLKAQCMDFVKQYSAEVVDMMLANFTPQEACVFIRLCSNDEPKRRNVQIVGISSSESSESNEKSSENEILANPQCELCKALIQMLEQRVIDFKSKEEIRRELEASCSRLRKFSKECTAFVDKYSDRIVDLVSQELKPEQVCRDLIFCVSKKNPEFQDYDAGLDILRMAMTIDDEDEIDVSSELSASTELDSNPGCTLCEFVIQKIEDDLNDHKTDEEIKKVVKNVCSKMPKTVGKECTQFVDYYFDMIIALIETSPPKMVCTDMKLCTQKLLEQKYNEIKKDVYSCAVCRGVVEAMDSIIEDPDIDTNLENLEEKVCEKFAGKFKAKCHNLASTYGVAIINLLKNLTESDQVCFKLELCSNDVGSRAFLT